MIPAKRWQQTSAEEILQQIAEIFLCLPEHLDEGETDPFDELPAVLRKVSESRPQDALEYIYQQFYSVRFDQLPEKWMRGYEEVSWRQAQRIVQEQLKHVNASDDPPFHYGTQWIDEVVRILDKAIIMSGAKRRIDQINEIMCLISIYLEHFKKPSNGSEAANSDDQLARKRRRMGDLDGTGKHIPIPGSWPTTKLCFPKALKPIATVKCPSLEWFQQHISVGNESTGNENAPLVITNSISHWPALNPDQPDRIWSNPQNLMRTTLGGRRLAPIETGRSYMDDDFGQKIMPMGEFIEEYMLRSADTSDARMAYLAQHDLLRQMPLLRKDIAIPDYCYASVRGRKDDEDEMEEPLMNAWLGPAGTITPLHRDNYHNIFAQVVGCKYVRLYPPSQAANVYPAETDAGGIDISNTSRADVGEVMRAFEGWDWDAGQTQKGHEINEDTEKLQAIRNEFPNFQNATYFEAVLEPGDCLYVPYGWWHYVRSLNTSFSVSFWWR